MTSWSPPEAPRYPKPTPWQRLKAAIRFVTLVLVLTLGLVSKLLIRLLERPVFGTHRPWSPQITRAVCRLALKVMGLPLQVTGQPMIQRGASVANHCSWLDIFVLNACQSVYFVAKSEVASWPGIGLLAKATGTVFIKRDRSEARAQEAVFAQRLRDGHRLLFFPEGTSTDGSLVIPFKSTLFAAFFNPSLKADLWVQPVSVRYWAPDGARGYHFGWWGDMDFAPHLLFLLSHGGGAVRVSFHEPLKISDWPDRKVLARHCEQVVRAGHSEGP